MALRFKPEALFKGGAKAAPKKAATKKVLNALCGRSYSRARQQSCPWTVWLTSSA